MEWRQTESEDGPKNGYDHGESSGIRRAVRGLESTLGPMKPKRGCRLMQLLLHLLIINSKESL